MDTTLPLTEARNKFAQLVDEASKMFTRFTITRKGKPEAILMSKEEYDALIDTIEILSNVETMAAIRRAEEDIQAGRVKPLEDVIKELELNV
jgi:prevent-host-death family protein